MVTYPWIDWLKALGITLVLVGHTQIPLPLRKWIFIFHMPLFFLCSGFLLSPKTFSDPFISFVRKRLRKLALAFLIFGLIGAVHFGLIYRFGHSLRGVPGAETTGQMIWWRIASLFYASGSIDGPLGLKPVVLWFFPALITGLALNDLCRRWAPAKSVPWILGFLSVLGFFARSMALPWEIESGMIAAGLISLGFALRCSDHLQERLRTLNPLLASLSLLLGSACGYWNSEIDFRISNFGNPLLAYPACLLILLPLSKAAMLLPEHRIIKRISESTLLIFPLHPILFGVLDGFVARLLHASEEWITHSPVWIGLKTAITLTLLSLAYPLFCRVFPVFGRR